MTEEAKIVQVLWDYMEGNLSLDEAVERFRTEGSNLDRQEIEEFLTETPRANLYNIRGERV